ncbi:geranylgeranyl pyrophosphate synthase [Pilimelia anulata]|uniref:Geranylgeranyl pyrophosphate synthase n=1 Tax=Pilimelia anulata TaxID=53371 RepID=A0A8J3BA30_9ACTN|nr:polyprenyl synthetase family protein [Pilimelia anulata]GGK06799.1 geranylgeranyl pyrophosphate synthase [Pilimelia anulata]
MIGTTPLSPPRDGGAVVRAGVHSVLDEFLGRQLDAAGRAEWRDAVEAIRDLALAGGKRTRPTFCWLGWRSYGGSPEPGVIRAAAALELFHAFALIHDDVMDDSDTRRGRPALHVGLARLHRRRGWRGSATRFGRNTAVLCGDLCLVWSDELFHSCGLPPRRVRRALELLHRMRAEVLLGQYLDLVGGVSPAGLAACRTILLYKSARYTVERPLQIGAALAGADAAHLATLSAYGVPLGEAFQLRDDLLGVFGDDAVTGKPTTTDLRDGKSTVLMALAREHADGAQRAVLDRWHGAADLDAAAAARLRAIAVETGALRRVEAMIAARTEQAVGALDDAGLDPAVYRDLVDLAHRLSTRTR